MYQLTAIFNKSCLSEVLQDLFDKKIEGITISDVIGKGGLTFVAEGEEPELDPKVRIDIVISNDNFKELAKEAIRANTQDTERGSGKMWVTPVLEVERIRTGETNEAALRQGKVHHHKSKDSYFETIDTPAS